MSIVGYVGKGFSIAKSSISLFLTIFGFSFIWSLINLPFVSLDGTAEPSAVTAVLGVLFMLISIFIQAGSIGYVEQVVKQGTASLNVFTEAGKKHYLRMLILGIVLGLIMLILAILAVLGFVAGGNEGQPSPIGGIFAVIITVVGAVLLFFLFLAPYAVVVDGEGVIAALKKSAGIVKANILTVLGVGVILVLLGFVVGFVLGLASGFIAGAIPNKFGQVIGSLLSSGVNAYLGIITTGAFMALYLGIKGSAAPQAPAVEAN